MDMKKHTLILLPMMLLIASYGAYAVPDKTQLSVWANEAIIATYTFDHKNYLQEQKRIAKYFTSSGWIAYSKALSDSKLPESIQKNQYEVSAVALLPPDIKSLDATHWRATMPVLVLYKNPQYQQRQTLEVVLDFGEAPAEQGVRGLSINSLQAKVTEPPCQCAQ
jgi:hypothetical protein